MQYNGSKRKIEVYALFVYEQTAEKSRIYADVTNRITHVKERFFHSFTLFDKVELLERQAKTERM